VSLGKDDRVATEQHPLLPYLKELEHPYTTGADAFMPTTEVVRFALGTTDYWAERAVEWLEAGVPADSMQVELGTLVADKRRPQSLRHRAMRFIDRAPRSAGT
jgi:hypothetical protein